jgi:hypothetical protein
MARRLAYLLMSPGAPLMLLGRPAERVGAFHLSSRPHQINREGIFRSCGRRWSLAAKKRRLSGSGTLPTHGPLFVGLLLGTVLLIGALAWLPAIAMGPVAEGMQSVRR